MRYNVPSDFIEIVSNTNNRYSSLYIEAANAANKDDKKSISFIKNFMMSIENLAGKDKVKDVDITKSHGNIMKYKGHDNIVKSMKFINDHYKNFLFINDLEKIYEYLKNNSALYSEGYEKQVRLIILEYENLVYLLISGCATLMANVDFKEKDGKIIYTSVEQSKDSTTGILADTIKKFKDQLYSKDHKKYLDSLIEGQGDKKINKTIEESVIFESNVSDTIELVDHLLSNVGKVFQTGKRAVLAIKNSIFGIVPLIRTILYMRYKTKADTVLALEQQIAFIEMNIEQLQNKTGIDPAKKAAIIKKQKAVIEGYHKKAAKLRAELSDGERETERAINTENPQMGKTEPDDDFVLEGGVTVMQIFGESTTRFTRREKGHAINAANVANKNANVKAVRKDNFFNIFNNIKPGKKSTSTSSNSDKATDNPKLLDESLWNKAYEELLAETGKDSIRLIPGNRSVNDNDMNKRTATKIGGNPYWPKNKEWPMSSDNKPLICLCQLNLSDLPNISELPKSGILQFFVIDGEWESTGAGPDVKVIHHTDIVNTADMLTEIPRSTCNGKEDEYPINGVYFPTAKLQKMPITTADYKFEELVIPIFNDIFDISITEPDSSWDIIKYSTNPKKVRELFSKYFLEKDDCGCRICGNPYFTQSDIRDGDESDRSFDTLLLQLDSEAGMMWGDCGIANFFISKSNLSKEKFENNVFYTWDCC